MTTNTNNEKQKTNGKLKFLFRFLIWTAVVIAAIFLTLFLSARIGQFESIAAMLEYIRAQFQ